MRNLSYKVAFKSTLIPSSKIVIHFIIRLVSGLVNFTISVY